MPYYVYVVANRRGALYIGITNNLERRVYEHKHGLVPGFTKRYNIHRLLYWEVFGDVRAAISREKQIKGWLRTRKLALVHTMNPRENDLALAWVRRGSRPRHPQLEARAAVQCWVE